MLLAYFLSEIEERRGRRCRSLRGGWATEEEDLQQHLQIWNHYQIVCYRKKQGPHLFRNKFTNAHSSKESATKETVKRVLYTFPGPHLFRNKSTNAHSTNESATKETVKRVLYTFPVEEEDVRDGDSFDAGIGRLRGLWIDANPEAPWDYKRRNRRQFNYLKSKGGEGMVPCSVDKKGKNGFMMENNNTTMRSYPNRHILKYCILYLFS